MKKTMTPLIIWIVFFVAIAIGYYLGANRTPQWEATHRDINSVEQLVRNFLLVRTTKQVQEIQNQEMLSLNVLFIQKIITEKKLFTQQERQEMDAHLDVFFWLVYDVYSKDPKFNIDSSTTRDDFVRFARESILTGKALDKDLDIAEIIANNVSYCSDKSIFSVQRDMDYCRAQMTLYHSKSSNDCNNIDTTQFPELAQMCRDYHNITP